MSRVVAWRIVPIDAHAKQLLDGDDGHDDPTSQLYSLELAAADATVRLCSRWLV